MKTSSEAYDIVNKILDMAISMGAEDPMIADSTDEKAIVVLDINGKIWKVKLEAF
jgi:hypothetical protein